MSKEDIMEEIEEIEKELVAHQEEERRLTKRMAMLQETIFAMLEQQGSLVRNQEA